jgi:transglutaminase-like putative cysteine protease
MRLNIKVSMEYALAPDDPALLAVTAAETDGQRVLESDLAIENAKLHWIDGESGIGDRVWAAPQRSRLKLRYRARVDVTRRAICLRNLTTAPLHALPASVLTFVRPSHFCPSDQLASFVEEQFGHLAGGAKIAAIAEWVAGSLSYVAGSSHEATTAIDTFITRKGVCRDYAHLVCSLARAANIPARYTSGYAPDVSPPDFHAVAEVWLEGAWRIVDATGMSSAGCLVVIGCGRDAGDIPFMETENWADFIGQSVEVARE